MSIELIENMVDENLSREIKSLILGFWNNRSNDYFPAPLPVSIEIFNFKTLTKFTYLISVKSDGVRYLMLNYNGNVYFIDRTFKIYLSNLKFKEGIKTMLFDGELVEGKSGEKKYIVHDCICIDNRNVSQEFFDSRYESMITGINMYMEDHHLVEVKKFFPFNKVNELEEYIKTLDHKTDGFILTPLNMPIGTGTQYSLFKWKPRESHTFDFKIVETNSSIETYVFKNNKDLLFASIDKNDSLSIPFIEKLRKLNFKSPSIVECSYDSEKDTFEPIMIRNDKSNPNSFTTVEKTFLNIKENITREELLSRKISRN